MKLRLEIELEYDSEKMHGNDQDSIHWFKNEVLFNPEDREGLTLHSNCIGDEIGKCKVIRIISGIEQLIDLKAETEEEIRRRNRTETNIGE